MLLPLVFIALELAAINHYTSSTPYRKAKLLTLSSSVSGGVHKASSKVTGYFSLESENEELTARIAELQNQLARLDANATGDPAAASSLPRGSEAALYFYGTAEVVNNSVVRPENFIVINKGSRQNISPNMALLAPGGAIVGYVLDVGDNYSTAISVLNINFRTGGQVQGKEYFGSIRWDGADPRYVTLSEISAYAELRKGDIVTTIYSSIFPSEAMVGTIESFERNSAGFYDAKVKLAVDFIRLRRVILVDYARQQERMLIEEGLYEE